MLFPVFFACISDRFDCFWMYCLDWCFICACSVLGSCVDILCVKNINCLCVYVSLDLPKWHWCVCWLCVACCVLCLFSCCYVSCGLTVALSFFVWFQCVMSRCFCLSVLVDMCLFKDVHCILSMFALFDIVFLFLFLMYRWSVLVLLYIRCVFCLICGVASFFECVVCRYSSFNAV